MKKKYKFLLFAIILIIIKQILVNKLPIFAIGNSVCDDQLMINLETSLLQLEWLGQYNSLTLVKGMFFPLFLAINVFLGISYINGVTLLYSIACLIFVYAIKDLFKNKWPLYIIFTLLLFNPIMYSTEAVIRVYRNSLTPAQVLLIFASIIGIFTNRKKDNKIIWFWSILGGISLAAFWNTREDAIWMLPMVLVYTLIMLIEHFVINKKKFKISKIIVFILPLIILYTINFGISLINYKMYGTYSRVDVSDSSFSKAITTIYSVPNEKDIDYVTVSKEKIERIYEISPSLKSISESLNAIMVSMDNNGRNPSDGEVEDGWFWWSLRFAAEEHGYYESAEKANEFFENVANEITEAQEKGLIEKQSTMPSALMSPWRKGYGKKLFNATLETIRFTNSYDNVSAGALESIGSYSSIGLFEMATNDTTILPSSFYNVTGWYKYDFNDYFINIVNIHSNQVVARIDCKKESICKINIDANNFPDMSVLALDIYDIDNNNIEKLFLKDNLTFDSNEIRTYSINNYLLKNISYYKKKVVNNYVDRLNVIGGFYKKTGPIFGIIGLIAYFIISFIALFKNYKMIDTWLIASSILASYLVLCIGVSYSHISAFYSISPMYLSGAYPLIISFTTMSILLIIDYYKFKK